MSLNLPAPIWRRIAASVYDALLLLALWMVAALIDTVVRDALGLPRTRLAFQVMLFLLGMGFFGWFWTHGGQTLGMRVWRLRVRRVDGADLRWPIACLRYALMLVTWFALLLPGLLRMPSAAGYAHASTLSAICLAWVLCALLMMALDPRRRAPCDWVARTEVIVEPRDDSASRAAEAG